MDIFEIISVARKITTLLVTLAVAAEVFSVFELFTFLPYFEPYVTIRYV
jgi:hypothetical protein